MFDNIKMDFNPWTGFPRDVQRLIKANMEGKSRLEYILWRRIYLRYNCMISPTARIAKTVVFPHPVGIVIGEGVRVEDGCVIYQNVTLGRKTKDDCGYPLLEAGCVVYAGATVMGPITLRERTVVGASAVVSCDSDVNDILVGVPARSVKRF